MAEVTETLLSKKLERGSWRISDTTDNFMEQNELTVVITLAEYRQLISDNATNKYKLDEANNEKRDKENENSKLKEKIKGLENTIFEYRKQFGELQESEEE